MKKQGWTFTYIGANHDVEQVAFSLPINNILKFEANEADVKRAFDVDKDERILYAKKCGAAKTCRQIILRMRRKNYNIRIKKFLFPILSDVLHYSFGKRQTFYTYCCFLLKPKLDG